ncbi:serine/threonine-protein kinase [Streptomyces sp. NPDC047981]|uniref:serine/threonine-protein kinase n=1 Tax=Streptomyces sp. NPDC047981 TaxID=3154610 RepID=UPI003445CBF1
MIGDQIAGYEVEREIGRGEGSVVYRAKDLRLDRVVALKLLAPELGRDEAFRQRFAHDSRLAAAIDHPHILPIYEAGEADGVVYIAMKYVHGLDLRALLDREGSLPVETALRIATQVASALDAAHDHDLVHLDVKPSNILVAAGTDSDYPEHVYLTGFGLSRTSLSLSGFTAAGTLVGSLDYLAPEQTSERPVDGRSDQYSLACVVYEALAGRPPFERENAMALLWAHQYDPPSSLSETHPEIPPDADAVLAKALAKSPQGRYASCQEFVVALRSATQGTSAALGEPMPYRRPSPPMLPEPPMPYREPSPPMPASPSPGESPGSTPPGPPFGDDDDEW